MTTPANILLSPSDRQFLCAAASAGSDVARLALDAEAKRILQRYDAQPEAPKAQGEVVVYPVIEDAPDGKDGRVYRSMIDCDYWSDGKFVCTERIALSDPLFKHTRRTPAEVGAWFTENYFPNGVRKVWPVVMRRPGSNITIVYRSNTDADHWTGDNLNPRLNVFPLCNLPTVWKPEPPAESAAFLESHGYNPDGTRKASPPSPAPVKGEDKCDCGHDRATHGPNGALCGGKRSHGSYCLCPQFTPAPQPTEQKAETPAPWVCKCGHTVGNHNRAYPAKCGLCPCEYFTEAEAETPAPDAELAAAKEVVVEAAKKIHASFKVKGEYSGEDFYALMGLVSQLLALESRKAVKVEGEWPKVFTLKSDPRFQWVVRGVNSWDKLRDGEWEYAAKWGDSFGPLDIACCTELPRAEVPAWLEAHGFNADGTQKAVTA